MAESVNIPTPQHREMNVFVGSWNVEGPSYPPTDPDSTEAAAAPMVTTETYKWLPGGYFLHHEWDGTVGGQPFRGLEILGYDPESDAYISNFFDESGNHPIYEVRLSNHVWTYSGELQRATHSVDADGTSMNIHWDWSEDGKEWHPLCDLVGTKVS